ncbi:MAG: asparagine synthase (glutamine-hydrolyzing) [Lacibacter sp.]
MCRIAGIYNPNEKNLAARMVHMRDAMQHGGPDDAGLFVHEQLPLALGHRRLSLIDLSPAGHQPMHYAEKGLTIVFNGEIYNFREIRNTLHHYGYRFVSESDTEVLLKAYAHWGVAAFSYCNGMFALAIWDEPRQQLILARDHAGIKPLYYKLGTDHLIFASEIRAFAAAGIPLAENPEWKAAFLAFGHLPEPVTTLHNVVPLEKGTALVIQLPSLESKKHNFFTWRFTGALQFEEDALPLLYTTLTEAVKRHLIADAPIGVFLSGGIDSSLLSILAAKTHQKQLHTLSIIFQEKRFSEETYQQHVVALIRSQHQPYLVTKKDFNAALPDALLAMDQPSLDGINTYFISKYARAYGLKAVLSGLGADELFGGYPSFRQQNKMRLLRLVPRPLLQTLQYLPDQRLGKLSYGNARHAVHEYLLLRGIFTPRAIAEQLDATEQEVQHLLAAISSRYTVNGFEGGNRISWLETNFYMQNQLLKDADYMSMWHGLELRVPFLDKEVMQLAGEIAPGLKFNHSLPKYLLVQAFRNELPEAVWNRKKQGFTFPFEGWLKENEFVEPANAAESRLYNRFREGKLSWGRYWCALLMNRFQQKQAVAA